MLNFRSCNIFSEKKTSLRCGVFLVAPLSFEHQRFKMTTRVDQTKNGATPAVCQDRCRRQRSGALYGG